VPPFFQHISQHQRIAQQPHLGSDLRTNADVDPRERSVLMEPAPADAIASCGAGSHAPAMFVVSETEAAAIRAAFDRGGELSAAVELRRLFPGVTDMAEARECARIIAGWQPLKVRPRQWTRRDPRRAR
jgi:hypothetical protein